MWMTLSDWPNLSSKIQLILSIRLWLILFSLRLTWHWIGQLHSSRLTCLVTVLLQLRWFLLNLVLRLSMLLSVIIARKTVTNQRLADRKLSTKRIKSGRLPAVPQSILPTIPPVDDRNFHVVSAGPRATRLTNVLACPKFANALLTPTEQLIARSLLGARTRLTTTKILRLQYFLHPYHLAFTNMHDVLHLTNQLLLLLILQEYGLIPRSRTSARLSIFLLLSNIGAAHLI